MYSLAQAGRVTGDKEYLDAAMVLFREIRDKMRDGPMYGVYPGLTTSVGGDADPNDPGRSRLNGVTGS